MSTLDRLTALFGLRTKRKNADQWIAQADAARDRRAWIDAATFYRTALDFDPRPGIWVQYGHALKESGDLAGGRDAYLHALELEPGNSDTALQLGHVLKLMGRTQEAIDWYSKAMIWPPGEPSAEHELVSLGVEPEQLEALFASLEPPPAPRPSGGVFWDVTPINDALIRGDLNAYAVWTAELASGTVSASEAAACVLCRETLVWKQIGDPDWLSAVEKGNAGPLTESQLSAIPDVVGALVVTPGITGDDGDLALALDTFTGEHDTGVVLNLATTSAWWMQLPDDDREQVRLIGQLDDLLLRCNLVFAATEADARIFRQRMSVLHVDRPVEVLALQKRDLGGLSIGAVAVGNPDLVIAPADDAELQAILTAHTQLSPARNLVVVAPTPDFKPLAARVSSAWPDKDDIQIVPPAAGLKMIASARSLVAPDIGLEATACVACACAAGVPVLAGRSPRLHDIFGSGLAMLASFQSPEEVVGGWQSRLTRRAADAAQGQSWAEDATALLKAFVAEPNPAFDRRRLIALGEFYAFSAKGSGLPLRRGVGWGKPAPYGSPLTTNAAALRLNLPAHLRGRFRVAVLVGANPGRGRHVVLRARLDGQVHESISILPDEGWGWITLDFQAPSARRSRIEIESKFTSTSGQVADGIALAGMVVYPLAADHLWFEFLDRASRGLVPEVRAVRQWAGRGHAV